MKCDFDGVVIRPLKRFNDDRGWLTELFRHDEIDQTVHPVMSYISMTKSSVARGPHEHVEQTDLFCFLGPSTFRLYLWDNREGSPTSGQAFVEEYGEDNPALVIIPPGVVHAYKNVGPGDGMVLNFPNKLYAGWGKKEEVDEIRHEDKPDSPYSLD